MSKFFFSKQLFNCATFHPLGLLQVHTTKLKNCDMCYLSKDETHPNTMGELGRGILVCGGGG